MDALLSAVIEAPSSDAARLAWADACEDVARADLVRTQCALEKAPDDAALIHRERALLGKNQARWERELRPQAICATFRRGFPEWVAVKMPPVVADPDGLFGKTPVTHLASRTFSKKLALATVDAPFWKGLRSATFAECKLDGPALAAFLRAPALSSLRALSVPYNALSRGAVELLLDTPAIEQLEWLDLTANKLLDSWLVPLLSASRLTKLRHLGVGGGMLAAVDGMVVIANHLALPHLESLSISSSRLLGEDLRPLEKVAALAGLQRLDVGQNEIGGMGALVLARGPWRDLEQLLVSSDTAPKPGLGSLAGEWRKLARLVYHCASTLASADVEAFVASGLPALTHLDISGLDAAGAAALGPLAPRLRRLHVSYTEIGDVGVAALLARPWPELRELHLPTSGLGDATAKLLTETDTLPKLHTLTLQLSEVSAPVKKALVKKLGPVIDDTGRYERLSDDPARALTA